MNSVRTYNWLPFLYLCITSLLVSCGSEQSAKLPSMELEPGSQREIAYTDKGDAFWVTRSGGYNNSPWHGLSAAKRAYLEDVFVYANGQLLPRETADITVTPVSLIREYPQRGIRETWTLLDEQRTLVLELEAEKEIQWTIQPAIMGGSGADDFDIHTSEQEMNVLIRRLAKMPSSYPHLKFWFSQTIEWSTPAQPDLPLYNAYLPQKADSKGSHELVIVVSLDEDEQEMEIKPTWIESARSQRTDRILQLLENTRTTSNLESQDEALAWAHSSISTLVMNQMGKGIYAGLPWFDDYWGRDAFISFTGAVLVSGQFEAAREILLSFAELQNTAPESPNYGRVPNRAQPEDIIYNTSDGTPWFVRSIWDYYRYSGDNEFLSKMWPSIKHATLGSLRNWVDDTGLLRHDDADTWMDAKGPDGPWSPRGDRAIDIQFIWRDQLEITKRLASQFGEGELKQQVSEALRNIESSLSQFRDNADGHLVDHLNSDDTQDEQIRPNVFLVPTLFAETCDWISFKTIAPQLVTKNGVLSLAQSDPNFHPYHHSPTLYVQDAAYHNGIIWTWNSAAAISASIDFHQYHYAQALFDNLTAHILDRGAIGTIAELTDAWPQNEQLNLSGTFSQAWSIAEYLRSFYQDILGVQPDLSQASVTLSPRLLGEMNQIRFNHPIAEDRWDIEYNETENSFEIAINRTESSGIALSCEVLFGTTLNHLKLIWTGQNIHLRFEKQMGQWTVPGNIIDYQVSMEAIEIPINSLPFCEVDTNIDVPVLRGPKHRLLTANEVKNENAFVKTIKHLTDSRGDDRGISGNFIYPANPHFEDGMADVLELKVSEGATSYGFEIKFDNLVDPGWHPEYGYQLTYCALGISYSQKTGVSDPGKNSRASFRDGFRADQIMYISGGLQLVDQTYEIMAAYMPDDAKVAIGNASTGVVKFSLPKELFSGSLASSQIQLAVGCQDDHGGAGIGDFRPVETQGSEWAGGGKAVGETSNVYDWLTE